MVRPEVNADRAAIRALLLEAFPSSAEADLVEALRYDGDVRIALAAAEADKVVGHVVLSKMFAPFRALGLAPVAVARSHRKTRHRRCADP